MKNRLTININAFYKTVMIACICSHLPVCPSFIFALTAKGWRKATDKDKEQHINDTVCEEQLARQAQTIFIHNTLTTEMNL